MSPPRPRLLRAAAGAALFARLLAGAAPILLVGPALAQDAPAGPALAPAAAPEPATARAALKLRPSVAPLRAGARAPLATGAVNPTGAPRFDAAGRRLGTARVAAPRLRPPPRGSGSGATPPAASAASPGGDAGLRPTLSADPPAGRGVDALRPAALPPPVAAGGSAPTVLAPSATLSPLPPAPQVAGLPPLPAPFRRGGREDNPFAPTGVRLGVFTLTPALDVTLGHDSNPNRAPGPSRGSATTRVEGELGLRSDWVRHELSGEARGAYSAFPDAREANRPEGAARLALRLDAARDTTLDAELRGALTTQSPLTANLPVRTAERPLVATGGVALGATQRFGRASLTLRGAADRTVYEDAKLPDGSVLDQSDRDGTASALRLRGAYEASPGLQPFVELGVDRRDRDRRFDNAGFARASDGASARAGARVEFTRLVSGEVALGAERRTYDDPRLPDLTGPVAEASLAWAPTPLTTVRLRGALSLDETTQVGASGAVGRRLSLEVAHELMRHVLVTASAGWSRLATRGTGLVEDGVSAGLRLDYKLTRSVALRASYAHERLDSTAPGADWRAHVVLVGVRLQR